MYNGLNLSLGNLPRLSRAKSRSISAENFKGEKGKGGMAVHTTGHDYGPHLGQGWKVSPCVTIAPKTVFEMADIEGPGAIQQMWFTLKGLKRFTILRIYWDHEETPSVEVPLGDFFGIGWEKYAPLVSLPVSVCPNNGFSCFWEMPFRTHCRMTVENLDDEEIVLFYQINYALTDVSEDAAYFHAQFRRTNPVPFKQDYTIVDGIQGKGHYIGTYMAWQVNSNGWWGEGEIKFFMDGDDQWPTICGTGTEDYFCGSYAFFLKDEKGHDQYAVYNTPYVGMHQVIKPDGSYSSQERFGLYRWHIMDPVRFDSDLRITMQALGWRHKCEKYLPLQDDIASVAYWYQTEPHAPFPKLPERDYLEVI